MCVICHKEQIHNNGESTNATTKVLLPIRRSCTFDSCSIGVKMDKCFSNLECGTYHFIIFSEIRVASLQGYLVRIIPIPLNYIVQLERMACKCSLK